MKNKYKLTNEELDKLKQKIENYSFPLNYKEEWGGAGVVITAKEITKKDYEYHFYSDPRYVITPFAKELSWLFVELRDIFYAKKLVDFASKHEFFGRLANAANWYINDLQKNKNHSIDKLLLVVISESIEILIEMQNNDFQYLPATFENIIFDDIRKKLRKDFNR